MPVLSSVVATGVMGNLASLENMLSPIVWTSIATGKLPHKHGVLGFVEPAPTPEGVRPVGSSSRQTKALWNILSESGLKTHVIGWYAGHPAEAINGICVTERFALPQPGSLENWPLPKGTISPEEAASWLDELRVHPTEITGAALLPFIPRAAELDQSDSHTAQLLTQLARILGKAASMQAAATAILEREPWDFLAVYFQAIDEFGHHFMPFHPPTLPGVSEQDVAFFGGVMEMAYRFHDLMLGRLLALAGPDVTVMLVSDHGFESGAQRPGTVANNHATMAGWHRRYGIIALAGAGLCEDQRIYGSSVLDVAPTVLHLMGLPVGADMDGKVLVTAMEEPGEITRRDTWDDAAHSRSDATTTTDAEEKAVLEQLVALGYLEAPGETVNSQCDIARREIQYNRIASLIEAMDFAGAVIHARELAVECPGERRYQLKLVQVLLHAGSTDEAGVALVALEAGHGACPGSHRLAAHLLLAQRKTSEAMERFQKAEELGGPTPDLMEQLGWVFLRQRRWADAESRFRAALELDPDRPHSHTGLARALVRQDRDEAALESALAAVGLLHFLPIGHFQLGAILSKMGDYSRAIRAFEIGLSMQPGSVHALRYVSLLQRRIAAHSSAK